MKDMKEANFLLVGVGGQGTILASNILAEVGLELGMDVKKAEVHGMSQRGGSVVSHVRWGKKVFSPILSEGDVDLLLAFEKLEAARFVHFLHPNGWVIVNDFSIVPLTVKSSNKKYPSNDSINSKLSLRAEKVFWVKALQIAEELGNTKTANVALLGSLSVFFEGDIAHWLSVIERLVPPKARKLNLDAFQAGRKAILSYS